MIKLTDLFFSACRVDLEAVVSLVLMALLAPR